MKHKTTELTGSLLDFAVGMAINGSNGLGAFLNALEVPMYHPALRASENWAHGGPIIEFMSISVCNEAGRFFTADDDTAPAWCSRVGSIMGDYAHGDLVFGETPLVAAMRAFVAAAFGDEVDL